ncbi:50S ribosomal protein L3 [Candidatus Anaplasma sp. TIGMIC]|uniref:50S ribosomal protein L3 n=1 Tax=Candidatus Anaplasma sp. TIGMIC TaxID=3020713 RepID=UPI00232BCF64|nr:50S ribosomal protein L3 [Candidatus Anaplasma sp. TIGMIC]MDB1135260.1 50S ribosomal protein L3 [Candidatus Anaplasma sp. TIGMIC]
MKKVGASAVFDATTGARVPVTLLSLEDTFVVGTRVEGVHGYNSVVLGSRRPGKVKKPQAEALSKQGVSTPCRVFESRVETVGDLQPGDNIGIEHFVPGQFVDVTGYTIGRGFAGVMKRHNFSGLRASHGVSISHRSQGSTGQCQDPGRVFKGKKMAGHMGNRRVTMQSLKVLHIDKEESLLVVKGTGVPGSEGSYVFVRDAVKKPMPKDVALTESVAG